MSSILDLKRKHIFCRKSWWLKMDQNLKKQVLRTFTYGLYAVSCANEGEVNVFTANWLTQVSFDPPLLAVSVEKISKSLPMILRSRKFTVNVLRSGARELAGKLGKSALRDPDKLVNIAFHPGSSRSRSVARGKTCTNHHSRGCHWSACCAEC